MQLISQKNNDYNLTVLDPSIKISEDSMEVHSKNLSSATPIDSGHHDEPRGYTSKKRSSSVADQSVILKTPKLEDVDCSGACGSTAESAQHDLLEKPNEEYLSVKSKLSKEVKKLITDKSLFKNEYYILEIIRTKQELQSISHDKLIDLNTRIQNLGIGENLVLIDIKFANVPYTTTNRTPVFIITKIGYELYNIQMLSYLFNHGFYNSDSYNGNIAPRYREINKELRYSILIRGNLKRIIEGYYVIGELRKKIQECSSVVKLGNQLKYDSMTQLLNSVFNGSKYAYDENNINDIEQRKNYLTNNISKIKHKEKFVFVANEYLNNSEETTASSANKMAGFILESISYETHSDLTVYKMRTIQKDSCNSQFIINDEFITVKVKFSIQDDHLLFKPYIKRIEIVYDQDLSNYKLIREIATIK